MHPILATKKQMPITSVSAVAMQMRPHISKILQVEPCLTAFEEFAKKSFIHESVACVRDIQRYEDSLKVNPHKYDSHHTKLQAFINKYIDERVSQHTVNLPSAIRASIMRYKDVDYGIYMDDIDGVSAALSAARDEICIMLSYRIPHFTQSSYWQTFISDYPHLVTACINDIDLDKWSKVRYSKEDFMNDRFTPKEDLLCDLMKEDQSIFRLQRTSMDGSLAIYLWDGKDLLDEKDIGLGKFQGFKVSGSLNYPDWLIALAVSSARFHSKVWSGCKFDRDYDFHCIKAVKEGNTVINYDTHICKLILDYGKMLDYRSSYVITENLYKHNRTFLLTKSIAPHEGKYTPNVIKEDIMRDDFFGEQEIRYPENEANPTISKKGRKKCIYLPNLSLFTVQPLGDKQSLFSFINLLNPGGFLLSKIGTPEKRMLDIAENYRSHMIREIENLLANDKAILKSMGSVYEMVKCKLDSYRRISGSKEPHIFDRSFEDCLMDLP